jgi:hypothetical protein
LLNAAEPAIVAKEGLQVPLPALQHSISLFVGTWNMYGRVCTKSQSF